MQERREAIAGLKILITIATIDVAKMSRFFGTASIFQIIEL